MPDSSKEISRRDLIKFGGLSLVALAAKDHLTRPRFGVNFNERFNDVKERGIQTPSSELVDEVETFGHDKPLTEDQLISLMLDVRSNFKGFKGDKHFGSIIVDEKNYDYFKKKEGETYQKFVKRHEKILDESLKELDPPFSGFELIRVVVVENGTLVPNSTAPEYKIYGFDDSHGVWAFAGPLYDTQKLAYFDERHNVDYGLLHEWGHAYLHLPDEYRVDFHPEEGVEYRAFQDVGEEWRSYFGGRRNDYQGALMTGSGSKNPDLGIYASGLLSRRKKEGNLHNYSVSFEDAYYFPYQVPKRTNIIVDSHLNGSRVEFFRTVYDPRKQEKVLYDEPYFVGEINDGLIRLGDPFLQLPKIERNKREYISFPFSTIFLKATSREGEVLHRWMDIRDFNLAYWEGFEEVVNLRLKLATKEDKRQEDLDWSIEYLT